MDQKVISGLAGLGIIKNLKSIKYALWVIVILYGVELSMRYL